MGGGLMQLVAYGAQDIYLTGNPQITFFKVVYRRHTNFAVEAIEQTFNGSAELGKKFSCTVSRNGDLLHRVYLEAEITYQATPSTTTATYANGDGFIYDGSEDGTVGFDLIEYVELEIGGQCIDKHYGEWMSIWTDLTHASDPKTLLTTMLSVTDTLVVPAVGGVAGATVGSAAAVNSSGAVVAADSVFTASGQKLYIPLQFWFCRNPGLALPLIALQYHEVKINVQFNSSVALTLPAEIDGSDAALSVTTSGTVSVASIDNCCVFCDYIFLDTDERRRFAQVSHEYLIEQVQFSNSLNAGTSTSAGESMTTSAELRFNHPVKELVWTVTGATNGNLVVDDGLLQLNGHDRFKKRDGDYFTQVQRYQHHSGAPDVVGWENLDEHVYSFALKPEEHQPSGTCNFSRIDNAVLSLNFTSVSSSETHTLQVYAVNYNVLRIMSGMGGLAYSN